MAFIFTKTKCVISKCQQTSTLFSSALNHEGFINGTSATYLEDMYCLWRVDPGKVHSSWDSYFKGVEAGRAVGAAFVSPPTLSVPLPAPSRGSTSSSPTLAPAPTPTPSVAALPAKPQVDSSLDERTIREYLELQSIIQSFRLRGHLAATLDPLGIVRGEHLRPARLQEHVLRHYKLPPDPNKLYMLHNTDYIGGGQKYLPVGEILKRLEAAYCGNIGIEYMYVESQEKYDFIRKKFETPGSIYSLSDTEKKLILKRLIRAHNFEEFLAKKYPSEKRFGLEGGEVLIPAVKTMIDTASELGVDMFNIGIAHRGRLNILANVVRKPLADLFAQFRAVKTDDLGSGDVKYHLGTYVERVNSQTQRPVTVSVTANPSHLEAVNPIVLGKTYAERIRLNDENGDKVAAQNCRKRKLDQIMSLADEVKQMRDRKHRLVRERDYLVTETQRMKNKYTQLYRHIFQALRDAEGNPYSPYEWSLQQSADGSVLLVPRSNASALDEPPRGPKHKESDSRKP